MKSSFEWDSINIDKNTSHSKYKIKNYQPYISFKQLGPAL